MNVVQYIQNNKKILFILIPIIITIIVLCLSMSEIKKYFKYVDINKKMSKDRNKVNKHALPLIENNSKYIELQTKNWIKQRKNNEICYGLLEKDKIIMAKWIQMFKIRAPKILYYNYHNQFNLKDLYELIKENPNKNLVIKITHLQSNYGIIIIPKNPTVDEINKIYQKCLEKFKTCFVCNHDKSDAPSNSQIKKGKKKSYYELYETIEPGIIIQDFFYSNDKEEISQPLEFKILVFGDKIINGANDDPQRLRYIFEEARNISNLLGSTLIRVDFFVKKNDNPYIPYLNEISLSPACGINVPLGINYFGDFKKYKNDVSKYEPVEMTELDELIKSSPQRTIPIKKYLTDGESYMSNIEKFKF